MLKPITYYVDKECKKPYSTNSEGNAVIDWGIMVPGTQKTKTIYAKNESKDRVVLRQPFTLDEALEITDYPTNLMNEQVGAVQLKLAPAKERIDAIRTDWGFDLIIG